ncbi:MAG: metallophosphoesterase [Lentisphaeria bacterium]|nr:metallophosphoesterase [Lentisphaeria bacterium]
MRLYNDGTCWKWQAFTDENLPEETAFYTKKIDEELLLPDGRSVHGKEFALPQQMPTFLNTLFPDGVISGKRIVLTASFIAQEEKKILAGFGMNGRWVLFFNGKMLLDARESGNSEMPVDVTNHTQVLDVKKGYNELVFLSLNPQNLFYSFFVYGEREALDFQYMPFVTFPDAEENAVTITFSGNAVSPAAVDCRIAGEKEWKRKYDNLGGQIRHDRKVHSVRLQNLCPGTLYEYRGVLADDKRNWEEIVSPVETFRTPVKKEEFSFLVTADLQRPGERRKFLEDLLGENSSLKPDFFAFCGDLYWTSNFDLSVMDEFIVPYREITKNQLPLVMVRGNHEIYGKDSNRYFEYFSPPYPGREGCYMFRWGEVCFIVLDFCDDAPRVPAPSTRQYHDFAPYLEEEKLWLEKAVKLSVCQEAKYRIVLAHGVPVGDDTVYMPENIRKVIDPVFAGKDPAVKIHLWLGGHTHRPMRSIPGKNAFYCSVAIEKFVKDISLRKKLPHYIHPDGLPTEDFVREKTLLSVGERYHFPVVVTGGPNSLFPENMQFTAIEVKVTKEKLIVKSFDRYQKEFDAFTIAPDGFVEEIRRAEEYKKREY